MITACACRHCQHARLGEVCREGGAHCRVGRRGMPGARHTPASGHEAGKTKAPKLVSLSMAWAHGNVAHELSPHSAAHTRTLHVSLDIAGRAQSACYALFSVRFVLCFVASTSLDLQARELRAVKARQLLSMSTVDVQLRFQSVIDPLSQSALACPARKNVHSTDAAAARDCIRRNHHAQSLSGGVSTAPSCSPSPSRSEPQSQHRTCMCAHTPRLPPPLHKMFTLAFAAAHDTR